MSLFGSLLADVEDDPFFGSHMRHMRQMSTMMSSMFSADPFDMLRGGPLAITAGHPIRHPAARVGPMMPFMPQMMMPSNINMDAAAAASGHMSSYSSSTVYMSNGPNGKPQVYSTTSSTKIGPHGVKETTKTLQDSRTGTKSMSIGHHIGNRAHVIERSQNLYSGEREESQELINLEEDEAEEFDREFQHVTSGRRVGPQNSAPARLAIAAPPAPTAALVAPEPHNATTERPPSKVKGRRPLRLTSPHTTHSANVRSVYGGSHPQRNRHKNRRH